MNCEGCPLNKEIDTDKTECTCNEDCKYCPNLTFEDLDLNAVDIFNGEK